MDRVVSLVTSSKRKMHANDPLRCCPGREIDTRKRKQFRRFRRGDSNEGDVGEIGAGRRRGRAANGIRDSLSCQIKVMVDCNVSLFSDWKKKKKIVREWEGGRGVR